MPKCDVCGMPVAAGRMCHMACREHERMALELACQLMAEDGICAEEPGKNCRKARPTACPECIRQWLLKKVREDG